MWVHNTCNPNIKTDKLGRVTVGFAKITAADIGTGNIYQRSHALLPGLWATRAMTQGIDWTTAWRAWGKIRGQLRAALSSVNRGAFRDFEQRIAGNALAGNNVFVRVKPIYTGAGTRPTRIDYQVRVNGKTYKERFRN